VHVAEVKVERHLHHPCTVAPYFASCHCCRYTSWYVFTAYVDVYAKWHEEVHNQGMQQPVCFDQPIAREKHVRKRAQASGGVHKAYTSGARFPSRPIGDGSAATKANTCLSAKDVHIFLSCYPSPMHRWKLAPSGRVWQRLASRRLVAEGRDIAREHALSRLNQRSALIHLRGMKCTSQLGMIGS